MFLFCFNDLTPSIASLSRPGHGRLSLEWPLSSPPPFHTYEELPVVIGEPSVAAPGRKPNDRLVLGLTPMRLVVYLQGRNSDEMATDAAAEDNP